MWLVINGKITNAIIVEGSGVTVIDASFAKEAGIAIDKTDTSARAAGNMSVQIAGQSLHPVTASVSNLKTPATLNLGHCLVVRNLGTPILLGQPAKYDHKIVTMPHLHQISFEDTYKGKHTINYPSNAPKDFHEAHVCRLNKNEIIYSGDQISYQLPQKFSSVKHVVFSPKPLLQQQGWQASILPVKSDLTIVLKNDTDGPVMVAKHEHFADIRAVISHEAALIAKVYTVDESEIQAFAPRNEFKRDNFTNDVKLDPDKILSTE